MLGTRWRILRICDNDCGQKHDQYPAQEHLRACWAWIIKMADRDKTPLGLLKMNCMVLAENKKKRILWWYMTWEFVSKRCLVPLIVTHMLPVADQRNHFHVTQLRKKDSKLDTYCLFLFLRQESGSTSSQIHRWKTIKALRLQTRKC